MESSVLLMNYIMPDLCPGSFYRSMYKNNTFLCLLKKIQNVHAYFVNILFRDIWVHRET